MFQINTDTLVAAVKSAKSPKMALDGTKFLLGDSVEYKVIFHQVFELAWKDASRRNRAIELSGGRKRDIKWKPRTPQDPEAFQADIKSFGKTHSFRKKSKILGRVLSDHDEISIKRFFVEITGTAGVSQIQQPSSVP